MRGIQLPALQLRQELVAQSDGGGGIEEGERLAAAGVVPDIAVVIVDALHHALHGINLAVAHGHELMSAASEIVFADWR